MVEIPTLTVSRAGGVLPAGVSGTDVYVDDNDGNAVVQVYNPTAAPVTITLVPAATVAGDLSVTGPTVVVASGATIWVGPLQPVIFNNSTGQAHITDPSGSLVFTALRF